MVEMVPDVIVHKFDTSIGVGEGGKDKKVFVIGVLASRLEPTVDKDGMDMFLMVVSIVRRTCFSVVSPLGS